FGPAVGGWLIALAGSGSALLLDAATFAVSAACLAWMGSPSRWKLAGPGARPAAATGPVAATGSATPPEGPGRRSALREVVEGFAFVRRHVWLWGTFAVATVAYLLFMGPAE